MAQQKKTSLFAKRKFSTQSSYEKAESSSVDKATWNILVVDDEAEVHDVTRLALRRFEFEGQSLKLFSAYSAQEAQKILQTQDDLAVILLDVVMEEDNAGLKLVQYIRDELKNHLIRIILRTGQPGQAPEKEVITRYDINDYKLKTELTAQKFFTTMMSALRSYRDLKTIEANRLEMQHLYVKLERANAATEEANQAKSEFLGIMSHEFRTPLNVILGMSDMLKDEFDGPLNQDQHRSVAAIEQSGQQLLGLIVNILEFSNIKAHKLDLNIAIVPIQEIKLICQDSLQSIEPLAIQKRLRIDFHIEDLIGNVTIDVLRLKQVLVNLLNNAVKFTPEGGQIGLQVSENPIQERLCFTVWDSGIGISQDDLAKLFQPFTQLDSSTTRRYEGVGIGLSLVWHLTEMQKGEVVVDSEVGSGSRFQIHFPWHKDS